MKTVVHNQQQLDVIVQDLYRILEEKRAVNVEYYEYKEPKTKRQLGFIFGALVSAIVDFYHSNGDDSWNESAVCDLLYQTLSPKIKMTRLNGSIYEHPLRISEMNKEQMSEFIDNTITMIDRAKCFNGLILHPSVRNTWIHHLSREDILNVRSMKFPEKCNEYLAYRRSQCCLICGKYGCEAHHIRESENAGVGKKANDYETISLCKLCHAKYHDIGSEQFRKSLWWILEYISLEDYVKICFSRWYNGFR